MWQIPKKALSGFDWLYWSIVVYGLAFHAWWFLLLLEDIQKTR